MSRDRAARKIIPCLPDFFHPREGAKFPADLIGAEIVGFGTIGEKPESGGLVIDYKLGGSEQIRRLYLGFNDLAMWVERQSTLSEGREYIL